MQIIRSCGVNTIATYLSLMGQDLSCVSSDGDRPATSPEPATDKCTTVDPASESHSHLAFSRH